MRSDGRHFGHCNRSFTYLLTYVLTYLLTYLLTKKSRPMQQPARLFLWEDMQAIWSNPQ